MQTKRIYGKNSEIKDVDTNIINIHMLRDLQESTFYMD